MAVAGTGDIGDGRAVCGEGVELETAGVLHLLNFPVRSASSAEGHHKGDAGPEVVDQGAGDLVVTVEGLEKGRPLDLQGT